MSPSAVWAPRAPSVWPARARAGFGHGVAWAFGVGAPVACFGVAWKGGWFGSTRVLVFGYAICCVAAFLMRRLLRRPRPVLDSLLAGALMGAFLFALPLGLFFGYFGVPWLILAAFDGDMGRIVLPALGTSALAGMVVYGRVAWRAQSANSRPMAWLAGFGAPPLILLLGQSLVWHLVEVNTPRLLAAIDSGVPAQEIDLGGLRILGPLSDWPGLVAELEGESGIASERDQRISALHERLTGRALSFSWVD